MHLKKTLKRLFFSCMKWIYKKKKKCVKIEIPSEILVVQDFSFVKPSKKKKRTYFDFEP